MMEPSSSCCLSDHFIYLSVYLSGDNADLHHDSNIMQVSSCAWRRMLCMWRLKIALVFNSWSLAGLIPLFAWFMELIIIITYVCAIYYYLMLSAQSCILCPCGTMLRAQFMWFVSSSKQLSVGMLLQSTVCLLSPAAAACTLHSGRAWACGNGALYCIHVDFGQRGWKRGCKHDQQR